MRISQKPSFLLSRISKLISIFLLSGALVSTPALADEAEKAGDYFQGWDEAAQRGFVSTSVSMALTIASQTDKDLMQCIFEWYGKGDDKIEAQREDEIIEVIGNYVAHQPYAVVLAVLQKQCGKFPVRQAH